MYPESVTKAAEFTPPGTLLKTIDYLRSLLYGATAAPGNSRHTLEFKLASGIKCVLSCSNDPLARYEKYERKVWKRLLERPTLRVWVGNFPGLTAIDLVHLAKGQHYLQTSASVETDGLFIDTDWSLHCAPVRLHASALQLAREMDLGWDGWLLRHVVKTLPEVDSYFLTKDGSVYTYDQEGVLVPTDLKFLGTYTNGHTEYFVPGALKPERLSTEPAIRKLQIDHALTALIAQKIKSLGYTTQYSRQIFDEIAQKQPELKVVVSDSEDPSVTELVSLNTGTKFRVELFDDAALKILHAFYELYHVVQTRLFWAMLRGNPEASKAAIERLNAAVYGVTGNLLFDLAEQGDDLGLIQ